MRLLYVEDHAATAKTVAIMLREVGYDIDTAASGQQAIELAGEHDYDLALVDVLLPDLSGFEVAKRLIKTDKDIKVVFQTGMAEVRDEVERSGLDARKFLFKPFNKAELLAGIERAAGTEIPRTERVDNRGTPRSTILKNARVVSPFAFECVVMNVSDGGAAIRPVQSEIEVPDKFVLAVRGTADRPCQVRWRRGAMAGFAFA